MTTYTKDPAKIAALSREEFYVTQQSGTERPGTGKLLHNTEPGIYVDIVSGQPLFSSTDKYDSGTGWPSFTAPIDPDTVTTKTDLKIGSARTEVRSKHGDSHLGHVFPDGPRDAGGQRYCMNSAALRFVPAAELENEGYGEYRTLFADIDHSSDEENPA